MVTLNSPQIVQETMLRWKKDSKIALVPTMGCLHAGHLSLVRKAKAYAEKTAVSIFVNPLQFGPKEDFSLYPRTLQEDSDKLKSLDVDLLFTPSETDLYPSGFSTAIAVGGLTRHLCGASRPGHFEGVATVCLKLFLITQADYAIFGEKDFQQLRVIEQMVEDLNLPLSIIPHETVREADGLAYSSRNRYLTPEQRQRAGQIPEALRQANEEALSHSQCVASKLMRLVSTRLSAADMKIDYAEIASESDLVPVSPERPIRDISRPRFFLAAHLGTTRLIDNIQLYSGTHEKTS